MNPDNYNAAAQLESPLRMHRGSRYDPFLYTSRVFSISEVFEVRMLTLDRHSSGRHFLQIPGPTNVPDRVLRAIDSATIDHRGPEFAVLAKTVLAGMKRVFKTQSDVVIYPSSGTGAWTPCPVSCG